MSKYKGKRVLIVGFGTTGVSMARFMMKQGAKVTISDMKQKAELGDSLKAIGDLKVEYELGGHNPKTFQAAELIVVSPGVPLNIAPLEEARQKQIPITTEIDVAAQHIKEPIIAITGTNGKTTTTTLIGEILRADGKTCYVGGNIGKPLIDYVTEGQRCDYVVAEISSFQLELAEKFCPAVAIFTNLDQDHLDRYLTMEAYIAAKKKLLKLCDKNTYVVLNYDDPYVSKFASETVSKIFWFTKANPMAIGGEFAERFQGSYLVNTAPEIVGKFNGRQETYNTSKLKLFGDHNKENLMAAICALRAIGVNTFSIQRVMDEFKGVEHRLEFIRKKEGVFFFNDSKATNVGSLRKSLQAFKRSPIILIAGGKDKNSDYAPLVDLVRQKCKMMILLGEAKEKINRSLGDATETYLVGTFEEAVLLAYQKSRTGDIVLLSPGCASYDMFRNFEERGDYFKKLVSQL